MGKPELGVKKCLGPVNSSSGQTLDCADFDHSKEIMLAILLQLGSGRPAAGWPRMDRPVPVENISCLTLHLRCSAWTGSEKVLPLIPISRPIFLLVFFLFPDTFCFVLFLETFCFILFLDTFFLFLEFFSFILFLDTFCSLLFLKLFVFSLIYFFIFSCFQTFFAITLPRQWD